ncbi:MAG TPA: preprotein translocase subunit SecE [Pirellulales bacterium]|nr:preprotein translocase subunit SecE [Pirellulales bacterium]
MKENAAANTMWQDLFSLSIYKRSQGRIARQVTFAVLAVALALGAWTLQDSLADRAASLRMGAFGTVLLVGLWLSYRVVNLPRFADFLIAVEAEMNKVSWPSRSELFRSSVVVMVTMFGLAGTLYAYDLLWQFLLTMLGVLQGGG